MSRSGIPSRLRAEVFARDGGCCTWCHLAQLGHGATFHVDHIRPRCRGGVTAIDNLALQCPSCSLHKSDRIDAVDPLTGEIVPLFHPLAQAWRDHFRLEEDGVCTGLSEVGRATASALGMNQPIPRFARACQLALGLITVD